MSKKIVIGVVMIVLVVMFIINVITQDSRRWNDGKCPDCGSCWELVKEVPAHHANEGAEIWECPHCHKTITISGN